MATIINTPAQSDSSGNGMGFLLGIIVLILFVLGLFYYGLPVLRNLGQGGVNVTLPEKVDVNVQQQGQPQQ